MDITFVNHDHVARVRRQKQEARTTQESPKPALPNPAFSA